MYLNFTLLIGNNLEKFQIYKSFVGNIGYVPAHALMLLLLQCILNIKPQLMQHHIVFVFY